MNTLSFIKVYSQNRVSFTKTISICLISLIFFACCKEDKEPPANDKEVKETVETDNGITYKLFVKEGATGFKGILVVGSGNNAENPTQGSLDGTDENELCRKAAENDYVAAIVQYRETPGLADWESSSVMIAEDYNKCIDALADNYGINKSQSVVAGYSYAAYMLLNYTAWYPDLAHCKGLLAACGAIENATYFHLPIYTVTCSGNTDPGGLSGEALYDAIMEDSPFKQLSDGMTDPSCNTHCGGDWTDTLYDKMVEWLAM